eukprot:4831355-Pleurochrysis_carterae.AAC.1
MARAYSADRCFVYCITRPVCAPAPAPWAAGERRLLWLGDPGGGCCSLATAAKLKLDDSNKIRRPTSGFGRFLIF